MYIIMYGAGEGYPGLDYIPRHNFMAQLRFGRNTTELLEKNIGAGEL